MSTILVCSSTVTIYPVTGRVTGYIVTVLEHTSIVDISEMESFFQLGIDGRQVVRHEQYKPVPSKSDEKVAQ
ncbi:hypothetical protein [Bacillus thuringiensis]|uniref:hypothetical protein n=1 Tax=Bacillus thuringiensis TaxID=1428 RepID=UPI0020D2865A|nr:hypothetical protein [Bacillus thuringiensis]